MSKVNVFDGYNEIIGRVEYTENLDRWDGHNRQAGGVGLHKGLKKTKDEKFVLIHGSQWQGSRDYAEIISRKQALQEILKSGNNELFKEFGLEEDVKKLDMD